MSETYSTRSNAIRAGRKAAVETGVVAPMVGVHFEVHGEGGTYTFELLDLETGVAQTAAAAPTPFDEPVPSPEPIAQVDVATLEKPAPAPRARKPKAQSQAPAGEAKPASKRDIVLGMLAAPQGATVPAITEATGWQAHTIRAFCSTVPKKLGLRLESTKGPNGERVYKTYGEAAA